MKTRQFIPAILFCAAHVADERTYLPRQDGFSLRSLAHTSWPRVRISLDRTRGEHSHAFPLAGGFFVLHFAYGSGFLRANPFWKTVGRGNESRLQGGEMSLRGKHNLEYALDFLSRNSKQNDNPEYSQTFNAGSVLRADLGQAEIEEVIDTLQSGWLTSGPKVKRFEEDFAEAVGGGTHCR